MASEVVKTVKSSGGDYSSLNAFEAGEQRNLVTADEIAVAECYAFEDTTAFDWNGWTTDATRYIKVYTPLSERHDGKWNTSKYRLVTTRQYYGLLRVLTTIDIRFEGLQLEHTGTKGTDAIIGFNLASSGEQRVSKCLIRWTGSGSGGGESEGGINLDGIGSGGTVKIWNNIIYDYYQGIVWNYGQAISGAIYYNTFIDSDVDNIILKGGAANNNLYLKNNIAQGGTTDYDLDNMEGTTTNLSEDTSSPEVALRSKVVTFVAEGSDNFLLDPSDTVAIGEATDLSTDPDGILNVTDDIIGNARHASTPDIGASEAAVVGAVPYNSQAFGQELGQEYGQE